MDIANEKLSNGFDDFVITSVAIKSSPEKLYTYLIDIINLSEFFPQIEYKFRFGLIGRLLNILFGKKLVRKQVLDAHLKLKEKSENLSLKK